MIIFNKHLAMIFILIIMPFHYVLADENTGNKAQSKHFHPKGKLPSSYTISLQNQQRSLLPFNDKQDFVEQQRGFIAKPDYNKIMADAGHVAWDMEAFNFLLTDKKLESIHPSLQRQALLNMNYGLYEVIPGIYQVRGFDLSNTTFIEGKTGWIVFDVLLSKETARAALNLINEQLGERPVVAVIYSHSHADHFGGIKGMVSEEDVKSGKVEIIAPIGFMENTISENVYAGNAMTRRMAYQYGTGLPVNEYGFVDQAIGKSVSRGSIGLIPPTRIIKKTIEEITIDGVKMVFHNTPGTEAPAEMNTWFPDKKAFWAAENITGTIHNIYTLRGAKVRDSLAWSKGINQALYQFGQQAEVMFASHNWPRWGNARIQEVMRGQRDMYANMNNQVLHLANQGVTINEIHNVYQMPKSLQKQWYARSYHGSVQHNSRAVINRYLGYWDNNPATLTPLSPQDSAPLYVEMMGGSNKIINKANSLYQKGKYKLAQEILNKLVFAEPENQTAKDLLADNFEQLGYQYESPSLRNSFLAAALELREGIVKGSALHTAGPDLMQAMTTELFLNYLAIRMDGRKAQGMSFKINLTISDGDTDLNEQFVIEMNNETLTNIKGHQANDADLTIITNRSVLLLFMMKKATAVILQEKIQSGEIVLKGNTEVLKQFKSTLVAFDQYFELLPGT